MDVINKMFLKTVSCYMHNQKIEDSVNLNEEQWKKLRRLANIHMLFPVTYEIMNHTTSFKKLEDDFKMMWRKQTITCVMNQVQKSKAFLKVYNLIRDANIDCIVTKGIVLRELYNKKEWRISGDEDILIKSKSFKKVDQILKDCHFYVEKEKFKESLEIVSYYDRQTGLHIEVHKALFEQDSIYKNFNQYFINIFDNMKTINIDNNLIQVMNCQEQLLYLICHAYKHFVSRGVGIRQIMDIGMVAWQYNRQIDWIKLFEMVELFNGTYFTYCVFSVINEYLEISYDMMNYPKEFIFSNFNNDDFLDDVLTGGVYGKASQERMYAYLMTNQILINKNYFKVVFPSYKYLKQAYPILNHQIYLLPVIWIWRIIRFLRRYLNDRRYKRVNLKSILRFGNKRIELFKKYKIGEFK